MLDFNGKNVGQIRQMARAHATQTLDQYWDGLFPVDPVAIARSLGASVFYAELGDDVYGMLQSDPAGANIYIDRDQPQKRKVFTCAHEIGHFVSHAGDVDFVDARSDKGIGTASEIYANEFAANLLMPEARVRELADSGASLLKMSDFFGVSVSAIGYRLKVLGITNP